MIPAIPAAIALLNAVTARLEDTETRLAEFVGSTVGHRLGEYLAAAAGGEEGRPFDLPMSKRDLAQLLRGRLGPRSAAAPEFWLLLLCTTLLGALGAHHALLGRVRSAPLFPLLTVTPPNSSSASSRHRPEPQRPRRRSPTLTRAASEAV